MKFLLPLLAPLMFFNFEKRPLKTLPCLSVSGSCLKPESLDFLTLPYPANANFPVHGIRMVLINDEIVFLKLSLPQMQYRNLCGQLGIAFHRNLSHPSAYL